MFGVRGLPLVLEYDNLKVELTCDISHIPTTHRAPRPGPLPFLSNENSILSNMPGGLDVLKEMKSY